MSKPTISIEAALADKQLLGAALGAQASWLTWRSVLKAAYGRRLTAPELQAFAKVAGGRKPPVHKVRELVAIVSRRAGKGRAAAALATFESALVDHSAHLAPGEVGVVACISPTRAQSVIVRDYTLGYFEASAALRGEIAETTSDEIRLKNGNVICTLASDFRSLRGRTLLLAIVDEAAFLRDELSANPDIETARALLPGLSTTGGLLCILSSPYRRSGLLHQRHRDHFGKDSADVLVVQGPSAVFNPTLDLKMIEAARASDPQASLSEWDGEFRSDLSQFLADELIESAVDRSRPLELPPQPDVAYAAFVDASAGRHDSFTICIAHRQGEKIIVDALRGRKPPFDPASVAAEFAALAKEYFCHVITGDNFAAGWVSGAFIANGLEYRRAPLTRSELYLEGLPLFSRGAVSIPDLGVLTRELRLLERRTARSGKDSVDHGTGGSDDFANSLFGALQLLAKPADIYLGPPIIVTGTRGLSYGDNVGGDGFIGGVFSGGGPSELNLSLPMDGRDSWGGGRGP
jgi:hypothetical protein